MANIMQFLPTLEGEEWRLTTTRALRSRWPPRYDTQKDSLTRHSRNQGVRRWGAELEKQRLPRLTASKMRFLQPQTILTFNRGTPYETMGMHDLRLHLRP